MRCDFRVVFVSADQLTLRRTPNSEPQCQLVMIIPSFFRKDLKGWKGKVTFHLEDHPRTCKWLVSPPFTSHKKPIWKGNNPILRGLMITMVINHLRPSWDDPPSRGELLNFGGLFILTFHLDTPNLITELQKDRILWIERTNRIWCFSQNFPKREANEVAIPTWNPKQPFINGCLVKQPFPM